MKSLVTISFALDIPEDELAAFVKNVEGGIWDGVRSALANHPELNGEDIRALDDSIDFYGATITLRRPMLVSEPTEGAEHVGE